MRTTGRQRGPGFFALGERPDCRLRGNERILLWIVRRNVKSVGAGNGRFAGGMVNGGDQASPQVSNMEEAIASRADLPAQITN